MTGDGSKVQCCKEHCIGAWNVRSMNKGKLEVVKQETARVNIDILGISETNTQKRCPFHYRRLECKCRKSSDTGNNRQTWPWSTKWSREKANRVLPREHTVHSKHPLPTTQEKTTHGQHQMVIIRLITFFAAKDGEVLYSQQKHDLELTVAQNMNSLLPNSDLNWRK